MIVRDLEQRQMWRCLPVETRASDWYRWGRAVGFAKGEEIVEQGAEDGERREDEAESLFGTG